MGIHPVLLITRYLPKFLSRVTQPSPPSSAVPADGAMGGPRPGSCRMGPGRGEAGVLSEELTHTTSPVPGKGRRR